MKVGELQKIECHCGEGESIDYEGSDGFTVAYFCRMCGSHFEVPLQKPLDTFSPHYFFALGRKFSDPATTIGELETLARDAGFKLDIGIIPLDRDDYEPQ